MARPRVHTDEVRETMLAHAREMVADGGVSALSVRSIAERAGTSTTAVYSLFGSKEELQVAVILAACDDFAARQSEVPPTADPVADIAGLGAAYVQWALDHPKLYEVMFGETVAGIRSTLAIQSASRRGMDPLRDAVRRALDGGAFRAADPDTIAISLWAQVHGLASLLLSSRLDPTADIAGAAAAILEGWRA